MGSSGKSQSQVQYTQSPEQAALYNAMYPAAAQAAYGALNQLPIYPIPQTPVAQSVQSLMPNAGWMSNMDPSIQQGLWEPTNIAARNMINQMGGEGMLSARGGYSGQAQTALGQLYGTAAPNIGLQAWNMISPIQQMQYQAQQQNNLLGYQTQVAQMAAPWQVIPGLMGGASQLTPNPTVTPSTASMSPFTGMLGGGLTGGYLASGTALGGPIGAGLGALLGLGASRWL